MPPYRNNAHVSLSHLWTVDILDSEITAHEATAETDLRTSTKTNKAGKIHCLKTHAIYHRVTFCLRFCLKRTEGRQAVGNQRLDPIKGEHGARRASESIIFDLPTPSVTNANVGNLYPTVWGRTWAPSERVDFYAFAGMVKTNWIDANFGENSRGHKWTSGVLVSFYQRAKLSSVSPYNP